jgi:hypothetical protein
MADHHQLPLLTAEQLQISVIKPRGCADCYMVRYSNRNGGWSWAKDGKSIEFFVIIADAERWIRNHKPGRARIIRIPGEP